VTQPFDPAALRVGTDERDVAIRCLDEHLTAGRLDADEYGSRVAAASLARTRGDIDQLFVDLPSPYPFQPQVAVDPKQPSASQPPALTRLAWLLLAAVLTVLAFASALTSRDFHDEHWRHGPGGSSFAPTGGPNHDHLSGR
jgi:Domain of unknown function (DUF1707)